MDPLQFAYRPGIGVEDAIISLFHRSLSHLEKPDSTVRILFFDFSSAFNTIQLRLLRDKLETAGVDYDLSEWILDYLTDRPQFVRTRDFVSEVLTCSVGVPQGTVLALFLFTLYTVDFRHNTDGCVLQKFSDDSAIIGLSSEDDDTEYRGVIQDFVDWCQRNHLLINAGKTKEMVVDFRRPGVRKPRATRYSGIGPTSLEVRWVLFRPVEGPDDGAKSGGELGADMAGVCYRASEGEIPATHQHRQLTYVHAHKCTLSCRNVIP
uniref:Reverse transcriptase domain-containing protein n=1 Tax=Knipowitschia caucasica TaxID=637954 RepID=A0AAV2LFH5_KNICA